MLCMVVQICSGLSWLWGGLLVLLLPWTTTTVQRHPVGHRTVTVSAHCSCGHWEVPFRFLSSTDYYRYIVLLWIVFRRTVACVYSDQSVWQDSFLSTPDSILCSLLLVGRQFFSSSIGKHISECTLLNGVPYIPPVPSPLQVVWFEDTLATAHCTKP